MTTESLETADMMVVTLQVPASRPDELSVSVLGHDVTVIGPDGFHHRLTMPSEADIESLHAELFHGILALRAPHAAAPQPREIPVQTAC